MRPRQLVRRVSSWQLRDWRNVAEAVTFLAVGRLCTLFVPFPRILRWFGLVPADDEPGAAGNGRADEVRIALRRAGRVVPWESACYAQAIAALAMTRRRNLPTMLHLGVQRTGQGAEQVAAHAWVRSGDVIVSGGEERDGFTTLAVFQPRLPLPSRAGWGYNPWHGRRHG